MARKHKSDTDMVLSAGTAAVPRRKTAMAARSKHSAPPAEVLAPSPIETQVPTAASVDRDETARLAYAYWEARGYQGGSSEEDWLRAEHALKARAMAATA